MTEVRAASGSAARTWARRVLVIAAALVVAWFATLHAVASSMKSGAAARAYGLTPWDGQIAGKYARTQIPSRPDAARLAAADAVARAALAHEPTSIDAVATLGFNAQLRGDARRAAALMNLAERLSRRDLLVQIWAIEDHVRRNDVPGSLGHYDIALRTSRKSRDLLFPILASAVADPDIARATTKLLADRPFWAPDFLFYAAGQAPDPRGVASLFARLQTAGYPVAEPARAVLINNLVAKLGFDGAWPYYVRAHPGADRTRSRDQRFRDESASRSPFDWQFFGDGGVSAAVERGAEGNVLGFSIAPGTAGLMARQVQLLPPGSYMLRSVTGRLSAPEAARPTWEVTCLDGRPIDRMPIADPGERRGVAMRRIEVPRDCPVQYLSLRARPHELMTSLDGDIVEASLVPDAASAPTPPRPDLLSKPTGMIDAKE